MSIPMFPASSDGFDDTRIQGYDPIVPPGLIQAELPLTDPSRILISASRQAATKIIKQQDDRLIVVVGPCSLHDPQSALEYAKKLKPMTEKYVGTLEIIMRAYLEKPRTTVGWKGLINDPDLDNSYKINKGLRTARGLYLDILEAGVPLASEMLDTISPQYLADLVSWGAIGARTTESQVHRELSSGLSFPIGFKNATDGNVSVAVDAIRAAAVPHHFLSVTKQGVAAIVRTTGNDCTHIILRGGNDGPNYESSFVDAARTDLAKAGVDQSIMVDCSHGNSLKNHKNQPKVCADVAQQVAKGDRSIVGVMIESHLKEGAQKIPKEGKAGLEYGVSITDACVHWQDTESMLQTLADAVESRRRV
ncbi:Phospho-2-dehydro-3-deoxyheptonate aldolase [Taphrina deformans PYCC 5710]|uniref:Phospho-2-dehydro-3-deoxyheptonate aldolase n=1 Tax=Taphrina deformans (strain PYCC 5710 / ATCC 11124 / CBS 356.35 / IMI 108563 / JCM 9778 / NBRC 8474) TaxID=1097556 RepID=R4XBV4_TAPDE|nr:Phospho-2-dehydro-3-deoxyheptonate aldolase [Taphrina deformans PYCC 5710]|eukprot:CCG80825.1 Phospho-2-dehydro-3-deoxyheptonate aldolase [Taphrina deformans PYCC 5710]